MRTLPPFVWSTCLAIWCSSCAQDSASVSISLPAKATRTDRIPLDFGAADTLALDERFGDISVTTSKDQPPTLVAKLTLHARDQEEAQRCLERFRVETLRKEHTLSAVVRGEPVEIELERGKLRLSPQVSYEAVIPEGKHLRAHSDSGSLSATGPFAGCELDSGFGKVRLELCDGDARLHSNSGDLKASQVNGNLVAESGFGAIALDSVAGKSLRAKTGSGKIEVARCSSERVDFESEFGDVSSADCSGALGVTTKSGAIRIRGFDGRVNARSGFGAITIEGHLGSVKAHSDSGAVHATVTALSADAVSGWELASGFGDVTLTVPAGFGCVLEATAGFGRIESEFDVAASAGKHEAQRLAGTIGAGGRQVTLSSKSGNVAIRKLTR